MLSLLIIVMLKCNRLSSAPTDFQTDLHSSTNSNKNNSNDQSPSNDVAYVTNNDEEDSGKSGLLVQFRRSIRSDNTEIEARRRSAVDKGFMRFGRANNMVRFGRSMPPTSEYDNEENDVEDDTQINEPYSMKMRRGNMMRFGKRNYLSPSEYSENLGKFTTFLRHFF